FQGYLPIDTSKKVKKFHEMERNILSGQTQIFIETPYRNNRLLEEICKTVRKDLKLCVALDITGQSEFIVTKTIYDWTRSKT
ncbi:hypothetical protein RFX70_20910, partial [Acinetobacter baumannii]|nr:hypothetical protein [Acinetobacter baumannii]